MSGLISLAATLFFSFAAVLAYAANSGRTGRMGLLMTELSALAAAAASGYLFYLILTDDFSVAYVAGYSSRDLPLLYKLSAFWAGQQGSFLLWLLIHGMAGVVLATGRRMSNAGMAVYMTVMALLAILVLAKSPFVAAETVLPDGIGMNPMLQDPWMAVHPPVIFVGYALLAVPLSYALGALIMLEPARKWMEPARRWTLFAWAFLGAGIFIGGYWAYKVLGWGGYWGWDPVENSSLVPWLLAAVLLHVLHVARVREGALYLVPLVAIFTYAFVIYGTFLTRSGVLGDFSVHSFSGGSVGAAIALVNAFLLVAGLIILIVRLKKLPQGRLYERYGSREFLLLLGSLLLVFLAAIVFLGMSMPLLTQLAGRQAAVDTEFYVRTTMPLAVAAVIAIGYASQSRWGGEAVSIGRMPLLGLPVGAAIALAVGIRQPLPVLLASAAVLLLGVTIRANRHHAVGIGGTVAHFGVALGLLAMVLAGTGSQQTARELAVGDTAEIFGYHVSYEGQEFLEDGSAKYYKYAVDGTAAKALTKLHKNGEDAAREPAIVRQWSGDIYLAPTPARAERQEMMLQRGVAKMDDLYAYRFDGVEINPEGAAMRVTADIAVTDGEQVEHFYPFIIANGNGGSSQPVEIMAGRKRLRLTGVSGDQRSVRFELLPSLQEEAAMPVTVSISRKPYIWLLWLAAVMVCTGTLAAIRKA